MGKNNGAVMCINTGVIYDTAAQAAKILNIPDIGISRCVNGLRPAYKGLSFCWCDSSAPVSELELLRITQLRNIYQLYNITSCSISFYGSANNIRLFD